MVSPQLCIVPATIVSGDSDGVDTAGVHFQSTLFILSQVIYLISSVIFFRFWIERPSVSTASTRILFIQVPQNRENYAVASSSRSISNNYTIDLSASSGFIFPNDFSQQQQLQQSCSRTFMQTHGIPIFFWRHPVWKMEVEEEGMLSETRIPGVYLWRYPWWINDFGKQVFIS